MAEPPFDAMARALALAERGRGHVEPNPLVGAVVVHDGVIVAEGWHARFGGPHAEVVALGAAGEAARGADLYVTLEPCCHFGKTPPCCDRVIASGIRRVVVAMADPYPEVSGRGLETLRAAGIAIELGRGEREARLLNAPYLKRLRTGRPFVYGKWAMTLDGKIAGVDGHSKWISDETSRRHAHAFRGLVDAIVVGIETVLIDNPLLTARPPGARVATRVVLDSRGRLPLDCQLATTARAAPLLVATTETSPKPWRASLESLGAEVLTLPKGLGGGVAIAALLDELGRRRMTNVLVEGGARVVGAFHDAGELDALRIYVAPKLLGSAAAPGPLAGLGTQTLARAGGWHLTECRTLERDVFLAVRRADDEASASGPLAE